MSEIHENSYQQEWNSLFQGTFYAKNLRSLGIQGKLKNCHFRSVCWKVLLECLPEDVKSWIDTTKQQRKHYEEILDKFHINPRKFQETLDISVNNPLSQSVQSPWNQYFQDSELRVTIQQDVVRTFPEVEFFHSQRIQEMMINILFSYAREHPHICYKQGMHELLAPIIFVLHYDQQLYLEVSKIQNLDLDIRIMLNQNYIEHDAFFLFCNLMEAVEHWYTMSDNPFSKMLVSSEPFTEDTSSSINSLGLKLKNIYRCLLKHHDPELFLYLEQLEITPQIYGIRWLRLLFGREFPIHNLLIIWDAIFADGNSFDLVDYIFVAMLIAIRDQLLKSDYASCLCHLMHYPNISDVQYIINLALHLRDSNMPKPEICLVQVYDSPSKPSKETKLAFVRTALPKSISSNQSSSVAVSKTTDARPKSLNIASISLPVKNSTEIEEDINEIKETFSYQNEANYKTYPRTRIQNVMESKTMKFKAFDVSQSFGYAKDKDTAVKTALFKEMVPLVPSSQNLSSDKKSKREFSKERSEDIKSFKDEISEIKLMNKYCANQLTHHISKLQDCMIGQKLLFEDEMFIALAGLKRARDILKGTVVFTDEVINDDCINRACDKRDTSSCVVCPKTNNMSSNFDTSNIECNISRFSNEEDKHLKSTKGLDNTLNPSISNSESNYKINKSALKKQCPLEQS